MVDAFENAFDGDEKFGNDAEHLSAGVARRAGDRAHQAHLAPAIDDPASAPGRLAAEMLRDAAVLRVMPGARPAINA
ncbi:MAG: hypothetical protein Kow00133_09700 [Amphiplicatus sp.]